MSLDKLVDTRLDPRTATLNDVLLTETYTVKKIDELVDAYGFALSETPLKRTGVIPTISKVSYIDDDGSEKLLTEQVIGNHNLLVNQFMCNYGTTLTEPKINRNYRIGQIFVNSSLLNKLITVSYSALGSTVNSDALVSTLANNIINRIMPVGSIYQQLPGQPEPVQLYPTLTWDDISSSYAGSFFRAEGGNAAAFGTWQGDAMRQLWGNFYDIKVGANFGADGTFYRGNKRGSGPGGVGSSYNDLGFDSARQVPTANEVRPSNFAIKIWRRRGTVKNQQTFYQFNIEGIFEQQLTLQQDEAGFIGYNPAIMTNIAPKQKQRNKITLSDISVEQVEVYNNDLQQWQVKADTRGLMAYHTKTVASRPLYHFDTPNQEETLIAPNSSLIQPVWDGEEWLEGETITKE